MSNNFNTLYGNSATIWQNSQRKAAQHKVAQETKEVFDAYTNAGFTEDQAMCLILAQLKYELEDRKGST